MKNDLGMGRPDKPGDDGKEKSEGGAKRHTLDTAATGA
jgi:hypothetical protein